MYGQEKNISFLFGGIGSFQLENSNCCNKSRAEQQLGFLASRTSAEGGHWLSRARAGTEIARHVYRLGCSKKNIFHLYANANKWAGLQKIFFVRHQNFLFEIVHESA